MDGPVAVCAHSYGGIPTTEAAVEFTPTQNSGWSVEEGADIIVRMATIASDGPTGTFSEAAGHRPLVTAGR